jgi:hypothetical protein
MYNKTEIDIYHIDDGKKYEPYEQKWLDEIFSTKVNFKPLATFETIPQNNSWFVVQRPHLEKFNEYFKMIDEKGIDFKVLHLSDEFEMDDLSFYKLSHCKAVIRNYVRGGIPDQPHIITIPLGFHHKSINNKTFVDKKLIWSFHGTDWFNRMEQLTHLSDFLPHNCHLTPNWNHSTMTKEDKYLSTLNDSKFCPIPRGNNVETFRMYECLESGSIPVYVRSKGDDLYWKYITSKIGLINIDSWENATEMIKRLLDSPTDAEKYRQILNTQWQTWKSEIKSTCQKLM